MLGKRRMMQTKSDLQRFIELFGRFPKEGEIDIIKNGGWEAPETPKGFNYGSFADAIDEIRAKATAQAERPDDSVDATTKAWNYLTKPPYPPTIAGSQAAKDWE